MTFIDYAFLGVLLFFAVLGFRKGLIRQIFEFVAIIGGVYIAIRYHERLGQSLGSIFRLQPQYEAITGFVILFLIFIIVTGAGGWLFGRLITYTPLGPLNYIGGAILGLIKGSVIIATVIIIILAMSEQVALDSVIITHLTPVIYPYLESLFAFSMPYYHNELNQL